MGGFWKFQSVLSRGELDPLSVGRIDLQQYYSGVATAQNVLAIPQGGLKKRNGQEYIYNIGSEARLELFSYNVEQNYLLAFTNYRMYVFKDGIYQADIATYWSIGQVRDFDYIQSADTIIITHPDVAPSKIVRNSDTSWTQSAIPFTNIPQYDFNDGSSPTPTSQVQRFTFTNVSEGDKFKLALDGILTEDIIYSWTNDGNIAMAYSIREELLALPNTPNSGVSALPNIDGTLDVQFSGAAANDWELLTATPIVSENVAFQIISEIIDEGTSRGENTWSATRGWPTCCTFHEGRFWLGGTAQRPQTIWGSFVNDFFNFKTRKGLDDESIEATLDTDQINNIQSLFSNRSLQVFTGGGEFYISISPITPEKMAVIPQTNLGSKRVRPVTIDGITLFLQKTGKALYQFLFIDEVKSNQSTSVSILAPHLVKDPIKMAVSRGTDISDANYVYLVNSDGTMTVFNTLFTENVAGFTRWETTGNIKSVAVVSNKVYTMVQRTINGASVYYLEVENATTNTDSSKITTGSGLTTITGIDHLEGATVKVKADGAVREDTVVSGGQITIDPPADNVEVGLEFLPIIKTMPLNVDTKGGPIASKKKKIMRASVQLYESNGIIINDQRLADRTIGINQFDAPVPYTGLRRIFLPGWSIEADVTITQDTPMDMTVLNIGMEVKA